MMVFHVKSPGAVCQAAERLVQQSAPARVTAPAEVKPTGPAGSLTVLQISAASRPTPDLFCESGAGERAEKTSHTFRR